MKYQRVTQQPAWDVLCPEWKLPPQEPPVRKLLISSAKPLTAPGEEILFSIQYLEHDQPVEGIGIELKLLRDFHPAETCHVVSGKTPTELKTVLDRPGFCRLSASCCNGEVNAAWGTGCDPLNIQAAPDVEGFDEFWKSQMNRLRSVPCRTLKETAIPLDDPAYAGQAEVFDIHIDCAGNAPVSGILARPPAAAPKSLPAYVFFHGAGVREAFQPLPWAKKGFLAFNVNAHGIENCASEEYVQEQKKRLDRYETRTYPKPEDSIFCDMVLRVVRALEYIRSRPEWDGHTLIVHGGSQGGFQTLAGCALDHAVSLAVVNAPAMCNLAGSLEGRTPSWPGTVFPGQDPDVIRNARFFDSVAFSRRAVCEAVFTVGFSDAAAVPSSVYAAYNEFGGSKKWIDDFYDLGHEGAVFWCIEEPVTEFLKSRGSRI